MFFKVNDKVKVIKGQSDTPESQIGEIGIIMGIRENLDYPIEVKTNVCRGSFSIKELKLIERQ